jgi:uncharacterized protein YjbI with pentapeptide repeats
MESNRATVKVEHTRQRMEVMDVDMSGSAFRDVNLSGAAFTDVNLAGASISDANLSKLRISEANLAGASIVDSLTDEMTINGVSVKELFAAYRSQSSREGAF